MHSLLLIFGFIFTCSSNFALSQDPKLLFVQILFRHGDRAPINLYPNDPNPESVWNEGLGKLTMLGRRQHYALGKFLRNMYENFTTSNPSEINVISSDCDRCMKSAETNLASFFAPSSEWKFEKDLNWQPISILYIPKDKDKYLETDSDCPKATEEKNNVINSPEGQAFIAEHKALFEYLAINSGSEIPDWIEASYLHDVLFIEKRYNLTIPSWVDPIWNELQNVSDLSFFWSFNSPLLHRLRAGPLLQKMIEMMDSKIAGELPQQKIQLYSSHDTNVAVVLDALNLYNMKQPPYCATLFFELYEMDGGVYAVRILYQNSSSPENEIEAPHVLILDGCSEFCPLNFFKNYTKDLIPGDWEKECEIEASFLEKIQEKNVAVGLFFSMMAVVIVVMSIYTVWKLNTGRRDKYSYHLMPQE